MERISLVWCSIIKGMSMGLYNATDKEKIKETMEFLISEGREITVQIEGQGTSYPSRIVKANYGDVHSKYGNRPQLVIERLSSEEGGGLVEPGSQVVARFLLRNTPCQFRALYLGPRTDYPNGEFVTSFPESIELPERRRRHRSIDVAPEFISVVLTTKEGSKEEKNYELAVVDYSLDGVGILVSGKDSDLIEKVHKGDKLQEITLFAPQTMVKVDGTIRHKSKKQGGKDENCYVLGVEFDEALMGFGSP